MAVTFLSLGSNLGDRELYLKNATTGLQRRGIEIVRCASVYETEPKDVGNQPWFLNTAVEAQTNLLPSELLAVCLDIERENGRMRTSSKSARTLDIDILFYADQIVRQPGLTIPHPHLRDRKFVLIPLAEIAPHFVDPETGETITALLDHCVDTAEVRLRQ